MDQITGTEATAKRKLTIPQLRRLLQRRYWQKRIRAVTKYSPHSEKQNSVHTAIDYGATRIAELAGRRWGKTMAGADECVIEFPFGPIKQLPIRHTWIVGPEFDVTDPVFEYVWDWAVDKRCINGVLPPKKSARERYIEFPWKSRLSCLTTKNPDSLQGKGVVKIIGDEFADHKPDTLRTYLEPVTADTNGVIVLISTPDGPLNHFTATYDDWTEQAVTDPKYHTLMATSWENPELSRDWLESYRETCERTGSMDIYLQEIMAQIVARSGSIYKQFEPMKDGQPWHVGHYPYVPGVPVEFGLDWGYDHPFVALFGQVIDGDRLRIFAEISQRGLSPVDQRNKVMSKLDDIAAFDPDAENIYEIMGALYADPSGAASKKLFRDAGFNVWEPPSKLRTQINSVNDGIVEVRKLLSRPDIPGLEIDISCVNLIKGIQNYVWSDKAQLEKPVKINDDECDALRYFVMGAIGLHSSIPEFFDIN